jgi:hypothetical protein
MFKNPRVAIGAAVGILFIIGIITFLFLRGCGEIESNGPIRGDGAHNGKVQGAIDRSIRAELVKALGIPESQKDWFFLNLPPAENYYPGSIIPSRGEALIDPVDRVKDASLLSIGKPIQLTAKEDVSVSGDDSLLVKIFNSHLGFKKSVKVYIEIDGATIIRMRDAATLKTRVMASSQAMNLYNRNRPPLVIVTAYEGTVKITVTSLGGADVGVAASTPVFDVKSKTQGDRGVEFELTSKQPITFAYTAEKIEYIYNQLGPKPTDVVLKHIKSDNASPWEVARASTESSPAPGGKTPKGPD